MEKKYKGRDLGSKGGDLWWNNKYKFFYPGYMFHIPQAFARSTPSRTSRT